MALVIIAFIGAVGGTASTILEFLAHRELYEILMKIFWIAFGVAGFLIGILGMRRR